MNAKRMLRPLFASAIVALLAARPTAATAAAWSVDLSAPKGGILAAPNVESEPGSEADRRTADGLVRRAVLDRSCVSGLGGAFAPGDTISVSFFDGDVRTLRIEEQFPSLFSRRVFSVSEQGALLPRSGTITVGDDGFTMHLDDAETGHVFRVFDGPDGGIVVEETDPGAGIVEESEPIVPDLGPEDGPAGGEGEEGPEAKAIVQGDTIIDYMVVFDASGAAYANTQGGIQAVAEEVVSKMNTALVNSDLYSSYRFRLVDVMTVSDNYTNINSSTYGINSSNLSATRTHSEITARRNANCADMWTTLIDTGSAYGTTGLGWSLSSLSRASSFGSYACNICSIRAVLNSHTLTHETGHNMGAGHSNASGASSPGPQMSDMPYSSGYHFKAANGTYYHTIMAYNSLTNQHYQPTACFSSPLLTAGGSPCGTADANDNRRVLLQTYSYAAAWKTSLHPVTYDVFLDKADGSLFDGTLTVTIECGSPTEPVYYTLDGTTPTASSSHYTGPIAITKTTTLKAVCISGGNAGDVASATYYSIPEVLGVTGVSWTMSGDADWRWDASQSAARSGKIGHSQSTTLTASLEGPGTLTFSWKADSERNWDYLTRTVSWETATSQISGTGLSWATVEVAVPSGRQTVSWTYSKDGSGSSGEDCGWVKGFVWTPDSSAPGGTVAAGTPSFTSCLVTATVTKTGDGATSVAVVFEYSKNASFSPKQTVSAGSVSGTGTKSATLSSLDHGTTYYVRAVLTGSPTGASATTDATSFTTAAYTAPTLGTVSASATTTSLTLSVPVAALGAGATSVSVSATLGGATKTATVSAAGGTATLVFDGLAPDSSYPWTIVATGSPTGLSANASGTAATAALPATGWFDVKWSSQGWGSGTAWRTSAGEAAAGGTWSVPSGDASSRSGSLLALGMPEGAELRFTASGPSAGGGFVTIDGTFAPVLSATPPDAPADALSGLCFVRGGYRAWNGTQWVALSGAAPSASATAWVATFDFRGSPAKVRYAVGGTALFASGSEWIALSTPRRYAEGVGFVGGGSLDDFKATYAGGFAAPVLSTLADGGHVPLSFGKDGSNNPTFEITIKNAVKDAWYTVYAADSVDGAYKAVTSVKASADGLMTLSIPAPSSKPTRFVRVGVGDAAVPANTVAP